MRRPWPWFGLFRGVVGADIGEGIRRALPCSWAEYEGSFSVVHRDVESLRSGQRSDDDQHEALELIGGPPNRLLNASVIDVRG
jgi:hypothetical protein